MSLLVLVTMEKFEYTIPEHHQAKVCQPTHRVIANLAVVYAKHPSSDVCLLHYLKMVENIYVGHSMSDHPMLETVPPQFFIKIYTFGLSD